MTLDGAGGFSGICVALARADPMTIGVVPDDLSVAPDIAAGPQEGPSNADMQSRAPLRWGVESLRHDVPSCFSFSGIHDSDDPSRNTPAQAAIA